MGPLCPVQAAEKAVLNYRVPLLNDTLPKLPALVANTTVGKFAQALVNDASVCFLNKRLYLERCLLDHMAPPGRQGLQLVL